MKDAGRQSVEELYRRRHSPRWQDRMRRWLTPPDPFVANPREHAVNAPPGKWNLYIGGAGSRIPGYVNIDLFPLPGVDVVASAECLPFPDDLFQRAECDAVLEHVENPQAVMREIKRTLAPGGFAHVVVPFGHPFHAYPRDYRRFTPDGARLLAMELEVVTQGWRTGPTATMLVFFLEYAKTWLPWQPARAIAHGVLGWV